MRNLSIAPTLATFKAAASASKDRPDMVLPILETLELMLTELTELTELTHFALDETSLNMLLSSLDRCHRWQDALFHLNAAEQGGLVPDLASYNSVISACARVARWKAALGLFAEIPKGPKALKADEITLGSLVSAYYRGHWSLALQLLYEGRMQNIQPNRIMVHSAIVACEGQHWPWSLLLLEESISWRVAPDSMLLGAVMHSGERGHQCPRCLQLLSRCFAMHCPLDLPMLTSCVSACGKSHRWEATVELLREVLTFWQVLPDPVMTHAALTAFASRPSRRYEQFAASLSATKGYIDNSDAAGRWAWSSGQLPAKEVMGGFTQQYLAEDLVDLRDLPPPLAKAAMSDLSNNAFLRSVSMSWDPMSQDSCGKVQGFIEHLGLGPGTVSVRTRQYALETKKSRCWSEQM